MLTQSRKGAKECKAWRSRKTTPPPIRFRNTYLPGAIDCHSGTYVEYRNTLLQGDPRHRPDLIPWRTEDIHVAGLQPGQFVDLPRGCAATYFPEGECAGAYR